MGKIYQVKFLKLEPEEKVKFLDNFTEIAEYSLEKEPFPVTWLSQLLIFTRCQNTYPLLQHSAPVPEVLSRGINLLWDYFEQKITVEEIKRFQEKLTASILFLAIGDSSKMKASEENKLFHEQYFSNCPPYYFNLIINLSYLFEEIATNCMSWYPIENLLYADIGDNIIERVELIHNNKNAYTTEELEKREQEIYSSITFCLVIANIQRDIKEVLKTPSISNLRKRYQKEYLFASAYRACLCPVCRQHIFRQIGDDCVCPRCDWLNDAEEYFKHDDKEANSLTVSEAKLYYLLSQFDVLKPELDRLTKVYKKQRQTVYDVVFDWDDKIGDFANLKLEEYHQEYIEKLKELKKRLYRK